MRKIEADEGLRPGLPSSQEREEIKALRKEVYELRRANEILKAASVFFAAEAVIADGRSLDAELEAREALRALAALPGRQRDDLALLIAGYSHREIAEITGGRTRTNVNKSLVKARVRIRQVQLRNR